MLDPEEFPSKPFAEPGGVLCRLILKCAENRVGNFNETAIHCRFSVQDTDLMPETMAQKTELTVEEKVYPLRQAFKISRGEKTEARVVEVALLRDGKVGRGEAVPYARYGETVEGVIEQINAMVGRIQDGLDREGLQSEMPAGAARSAVDLAMWDLDARLAGTPVWQTAGLPKPEPILCTETISLGEPGDMAAAAREATSSLLKLKLGGAEDLERVRAVHEARSEAKLILDANEGLSFAEFREIARAAARMGVVLIEQPLPADKDDALIRSASPVALCADESVHTVADLDGLARRYDAVNVKLDKAGGLTAALELVRGARARGMHVMVGCMVGSSLAMAPAVLLAQIADAADLDGPIWLKDDIDHGLVYKDGEVHPPQASLWGG